MRGSGVMAPGSNARLMQQRVYKRRQPDKLAGFWKSPNKRNVFVPLGSRKIPA